MLERFEIAEEAERGNRKGFVEAQDFYLGGDNQWDAAVLKLRVQDNRPRESYNQIPQFVHQITNDARMNSTQTRFIPGDDAEKETAEVREDLARNIQSGAEADIAYDTALENAVIGGWGYWRYLTQYENDETFDQIIKLDWIPNPLVIYDDPNTQRADRLDRKWLIHTTDIPSKDYNDQYPDFKYDSLELTSLGNQFPDWASQDMVRVAEYWEVEETTTKLYRNKGTGKITDKEPTRAENYDVRDVVECKVIWRKCTASKVLDKRDWPGYYIPYAYTCGEEKIVNGKRIVRGLVENMMAPQRQYNIWSNAVTEQVGLSPKAPWVISMGAIKGFEEYWDTSNVRNWSYLPYHAFDEQKNQNQVPSRVQSGVDISAGVALIQQAQQNFYATTGIYPASLGAKSNETSGRAIMARQREGDVSTFHYIDNLDRAKLAGGLILDDLITEIYDGSRVVTTAKEDKTVKKVKINQEYTDEKGRKKNHDMTKGTYDVMITTGPSYTTKRQEAAESMVAMMQTPIGQAVATVAPDMVVANMDWPGADKLAERLKKTVPPEILADDDDAPQIPPQVIQQMQQMQQMIEQMGQELQAAQGELNSKQLDIQKKEADLQGQMMKNEQTSQSQALALEIRAAKAEMAVREMQLQMGQRDIEIASSELQAMQAQVSEELNNQAEVNDLAVQLSQQELKIQQLEIMRQNDLADMELQQQYKDMVNEYQLIQKDLSLAVVKSQNANKATVDRTKKLN